MKNPASNSLQIIPAALGLWLLAGLLACPSPATAQSYWDPGSAGGTGSGGPGTWNSANANWFTGSSDTTWTPNNIAYFEGSAGLVTLGAAETANGLTFTTAGYALNTNGTIPSCTLTLAGTPTITVPSSGATIIGCVLAGTTGCTVTGGALTLTNVETYTGVTTISSGATLTIGAPGQLGSGSYAGNITDNGAFIYNSTAAQTLSAVISGSGTLTQNGSGALTISGTGNSYTGITTVNSSYVSIARDLSLGAVPTSSFNGWNGTCVPNQLTLNCGSTANVGIRWTASGQLPLNAARGVYLTAGSHNAYFGSSGGSIATIAGPISGPGNFQSGAAYNSLLGTNVLTGLSTYTGTTTIAAGRLMLGVAGALPYGTPLTIGSDNDTAGNGGIFDLNGYSQTIGPLTGSAGTPSGGTANPTIVLSGALTILQTNSTTFGGYIVGSGSITLNGATNQILSLSCPTNSYTGGTTINSGYLQINNSDGASSGNLGAINSTLTLNCGGSCGLRANASLALSASHSIILGTLGGTIFAASGFTLNNPCAITGTGNFWSGANDSTGSGTNLMSGLSGYSGATAVACGRLLLGANGALPSGTSLTVGADTAGGAIFDLGGFSQTIGPLASSTGLNGTGTGTPTIVLTGALTVNENANTTFAGQIIGSGGSLTLSPSSTAALTLSGTNTFTGATAVNGGELVGVTGGSCSNSAVTVSGGATDSVSITDNTMQWTCAGLTFNPASALDFNFGYSVAPSTSLAPLNVNGAAAFNGTPTVTIEGGGFPAGSGTYPLMTWTSTSGTPPATATLPNRVTGSLSVSGNTLYLNAASTEPLRWTGAAANGLWDINTSQNWKDSAGSATDYEQTTVPGDAVILDDTYISASPVITLNGTVSPASVTASNNTYNYTISGSGAIAGAASLTMLGSGTLTLGCANTYSGSTTVAGGTLSVGVDNNLGAVPASTTPASIVLSNAALSANASFALNPNRGITMQDNSTLDVASGKTLNYAGVIAGPSFNLTKTGSGTVIISQDHNSYSGNTIISAGILQTGGDHSTAGTPSNLGAYPSSFVPNNITLAGGTLQGNNPNFQFYTNRGVTLTANSGLSSLGGCQTGIQGPITGNYGITMSSLVPNTSTPTNGVVYLEGTNTYTGNTIIGSGVLSLTLNGSISNSPSISIAAGATLDVSSNSAPFALASGQSLTASGYGIMPLTNAATINGPASGAISLGSQPIILNFTPVSFSGDTTHPSLYVPQGSLSLNGNSFTVNNLALTPLGVGTYLLIQQASGTISSSGSYSVSVTGTGLASDTAASISVSGTSVNLVVAASAVTRPGINSVTLSGGNLIFSGTNGSDSGKFYVLASTNVALPLSNWTSIATDTFGPTGDFSVTNSVGVYLNRFFIIQTP